MRVLQLTAQLDGIGGVMTYVRSLTRWLVDSGVECLVLSGDAGGLDCDARVEHAPDLASALRRGTSPTSLLARIDAWDPDVVLVHVFPDGVLLDSLVSAGVPAAAFVHGFICSVGKVFRRNDTVCSHPVSPRCLWDWYAGPCGSGPSPVAALQSHRRAVAYRAALQRAGAVVVASEFMRKYLEAEGIAADRITVERWDPEQTQRVLPSGELRSAQRAQHPQQHNVVYVGRLTYDKGVHHLIDAMTHLGTSYTLRIVGDGWYRPALQARSTRLGLGDRARFAGGKAGDALRGEYASADVVVVPSVLPEPWGLVVGEAAAAGVPVVVSDVGGLPEWQSIVPGVVTCPPASAPALAQAIEQACSAPLHGLRSGGERPHRQSAVGPAVLVDCLRNLADTARNRSFPR